VPAIVRLLPELVGSPNSSRMMRGLFLCLAGILLHAPVTPASEIWLPFDKSFEMSDIVCIADAVASIPAPDPTAENTESVSTYLLRPLHVWKGGPPDSLILAGRLVSRSHQGSWIIEGDALRHFEVGRRYLVFASYPKTGGWPYAHSHTRELLYAKADQLLLERRIGPGRVVATDIAAIPSVTYRSLARDLDGGDGPTQLATARALKELEDSADVVLPALIRAVHRSSPASLRGFACETLVRWSSANEATCRAFLDLMKDDDFAVRLQVGLSAIHAYANADLQRRVLELRTDAVPEVRAAALRGCAELLSGEQPPIREYLEALRDTAGVARLEAVCAFQRRMADSVVEAAVRARLTDADSTVVAVAKHLIERQERNR
jgi:hypothetical protein